LLLVSQPGVGLLGRFQLFSGVLAYMASGGIWVITWLLSAHEIARVEWHELAPLVKEDNADQAEAEQYAAMSWLMIGGAALVFASRFLVFMLMMLDKDPGIAAGGQWSFGLSMFVEFVFTVICTPMLTVTTTLAIVRIVLLGHRGTWEKRNREERALEWGEVLGNLGGLALLALAAPAVYFALDAPLAAIWITPICGSVLLSVPLAKLTSGHAECIESWGIMTTRYDVKLPPEVVDVDRYLALRDPLNAEWTEHTQVDLARALESQRKGLQEELAGLRSSAGRAPSYP
jgi:membrane glycosyltransferase